ncbi:PP2C family protein-serine/threonine phosphatase [Streptomyces sp. KR80]|uniref:PP2C family protein-serine/threonine phosphatase n=1 Tax=Streptomyces sp. KR80 TaxID=3457426 RepID=UPI003FD54054
MAAGERDAAPRREPLSPAAEAARMEAVRHYDILDTPPDRAFDRIAALAARLFDVPVATVTIVDTDRIWFKAGHGLNGMTQVSREPGMCATAILADEALVVPDTLTDPVAHAHPLVTGPTQIRFYAGAPITTAEGHRLGTVNILDCKPRQLTAADIATLTDLAAIVLNELELRLSAMRALRAERELLAVERAARQQAERNRAELADFASTLQRKLLPPALPPVPGLELACHYSPASARDVGGDFYDVFSLGGDRWAFFLGDVCGKGAHAAALTSLVRYTLRAAAWHNPDPQAALEMLNAALLLEPDDGSRFCTVVFGTLDPDPAGGFTVTVATGGHPPAYHLQPDGFGTLEHAKPVPPAGGTVIGVIPEVALTTARFRLAPGEALLLYTDGLTEARARDGTRFGDDALTAHLARSHASDAAVRAPALMDNLVSLLSAFPFGPSDDVALLALSVPP